MSWASISGRSSPVAWARSTSAAVASHQLVLLALRAAERVPLGHRLRKQAIVRPQLRRAAKEIAKPLPGIGGLERLAPPLGEPGEAVRRQRLEQRLLGRKVAVDRADADVRCSGDVVDLRLQAVGRELCPSGGEDPLAIAPGVGALPDFEGGSGWGLGWLRIHVDSRARRFVVSVTTSTQTEPKFRIVPVTKPELSFRLSHKRRPRNTGDNDDDHRPGIRTPTLDRPRAALLRPVHRRPRRIDRQRRPALDWRGARFLAGEPRPGW